MTTPDPGPPETAGRTAAVAATADHVLSVLGALRGLDLDGVRPAAEYRPDGVAYRPAAADRSPHARPLEGERADAAV
ncbi:MULTISPECIES: hypothetical protein [Streptomyces]|uniref:hypothetical protein n=1 Tax=Streptomyces TaxID=1883 RepID=UPI00163CA175|nr:MULTISPECIES: hypothetical protein [Streptomyces]MBC2876529.1 hypothetical protein [Streptomyces sp. TYQ1024]UBI40798.1 hypothetical protein K7I03_32910 [Streptomyces mobaraensis]